MAKIGSLEAFDGDDFEPYQERLESYFLANDIGLVTTDEKDKNYDADVLQADKKKVAHMISLMGKEAYTVLKDLCLPAKPKDKTFDELCKLLTDYYKPSLLIVAESYKFHQARQELGESVSIYANRLRRLAANCQFNDFLDRALRDKFVCGIRDQSTLKRLLSKDLSFQKCLEQALADESADKETRNLTNSSETVHYVPSAKKKGQGGQSKCFRCGSDKHHANKCHLKDSGQICTYCEKPNHTATECFKKKNDERKGQNVPNRSNSNVRQIAQEMNKVSIWDEEKDIIPMMAVTQELKPQNNLLEGPTHMINNTRQASYKTDVSFNGNVVNMEIDTGSGVTILSKQDYDNMSLASRNLETSRLILKGYSGSELKCLGERTMQVNINGQTKEAIIRVVDCNGPSLLGRDLISMFTIPWQNIFKLSTNEDYNKLIDKYDDMFDNSKPGKIKDLKVKLHVKDDVVPIFKKARPVPYAIRDSYCDSLDKLVEDGIMEKVEFSEWASPVVPVIKSSGDIRLCGDYSGTINKHIVSDVYPLPTLDDIVNKVGFGEKFTKLDLSQAFHQFELDDKSKKYTTINTIKGLYQYNRLVFGVPPATAICQRTMENILKDIQGVVVRVDDILITGKTDAEHLNNLEEVLKRLHDKGLKLQKSKVQFMLSKVEYNGFDISKNEVRPTVDKVEAIHGAEAPNNVTELRAFIGLANYLRNFIPKFAQIMFPLYQLLKKDIKWKWTKTENDAFNSLKNSIGTERNLRRYNPQGDLILQTDASGVGVGATILQTNEEGFLQPISYASRVLTKAEQNYSNIERELLGVIFGVTKFRLFVLGRKFLLQTDHKPLTKICNEHETLPQLVSNRIKKWTMILKAYNFKISHIAGKNNVIADFLSRKPINNMTSENEKVENDLILMVRDNETVTADCIASETRKDKVLREVIEFTRNGWDSSFEDNLLPYFKRRFELSVENDILLWGERVVIPDSLREILLRDLHTEHLGIVRSKQLARVYLWWPKIDSDIENMVKVCPRCQEHAKDPRSEGTGTWSWPTGPWKRIHIDYAGPDEQNWMYLVVVDAYSKYLEIFPMKKTDSSHTIEKLRHLFSQFGLPEHIVSDNGPQFVSEEFETFLRRNVIQHTKTPPRHPATNGLAERYVGYFKQSMKRMSDIEETIQCRLDRFLLTYRSTPTNTGRSPAELLMNKKLRTRLTALRFSKTKEQVKVFQDNLEQKPKFRVSDAVFAKNFGKGNDWLPGTIIDIISPKSFLVQVRDVVWKRHADQLKPRIIPSMDQSYTNSEQGKSMLPQTDNTFEKLHDMSQEKETPVEEDPEDVRRRHQTPDPEYNIRGHQDISSRRTSARIRTKTSRLIEEI